LLTGSKDYFHLFSRLSTRRQSTPCKAIPGRATLTQPMNDTSTTVQTAPPPPGRINWDLVRDLYIQQVPHSVIAERTGASIHAIRSRAYRHRWAHDTNNDLLANPPTQQELVSEWLENMSLSILASSRWWSKHDLEPENLRESRDLEAARSSHIDAGRKLFGLDRQDNVKASAWAAGAAVGPVIDVTPVIQDKP
jgi:hypothetical protein